MDLTGLRVGRLEVVEPAGRDAAGSLLWRCRCSCGATPAYRASPLARGQRLSCGCARYDVMDLTGQTYGRLTVLALAERRAGDRGARWRCQCACGNITEVAARSLRSDDNTQSCGCRAGRPGSGRLRCVQPGAP